MRNAFEQICYVYPLCCNEKTWDHVDRSNIAFSPTVQSCRDTVENQTGALNRI